MSQPGQLLGQALADRRPEAFRITEVGDYLFFLESIPELLEFFCGLPLVDILRVE